jgi:hypothetical protein
MSKLTTEEKDRIIRRDLPGYRVVEESTDDSAADLIEPSRPQPEAGTPDIQELRRKYFGVVDEWANGPASKESDAGNDEDEIVTVEPENKSDALDRGGRAKAVVISNGEVTGSQG